MSRDDVVDFPSRSLVPGFDIASEYYDLHQTVLTGIWHTAHPGDAYGAMLSVTVMPAELHFLSGVPDLLVFSVVYPAIGALLPVAVFGLARRILSRRWAFAAAIFVIAQAFRGTCWGCAARDCSSAFCRTARSNA